MSRNPLLLLAIFCLAAPANAQTLQEIDKRDAAVIEAWNATPLSIRKAVFVSQHPNGYGEYAERPNNAFKQGEKLVAYAEPVGYGWKDAGDGKYQFGFTVDFVIKSPDGKVLGGQENFADLTQTSYARNREFMVILNLSLSDAPPGDYVVEYKLHDIASNKTATFSLPFKIVA
jgi:hypothetical protein